MGATWEPTTVPHVFDARPLAQLFKGARRLVPRSRFKGPATAPGIGWWLRFEQVRRKARVWLNGVELGANTDPYTPFQLPGDGPEAGPDEHARRARRQPPHARHARGLVELGRDHAAGVARPARAASCCTTPASCRSARARATARAAAGARSSTAGSRTAARARSARACAVTLRAPDGRLSARQRAPAHPAARRARARALRGARCRATRSSGRPSDPNLYDATVRTLVGGRVDPARPAAHRPAHGRRSSTARCGSTAACSTCAARRSRRTCPAAAPR